MYFANPPKDLADPQEAVDRTVETSDLAEERALEGGVPSLEQGGWAGPRVKAVPFPPFLPSETDGQGKD